VKKKGKKVGLVDALEVEGGSRNPKCVLTSVRMAGWGWDQSRGKSLKAKLAFLGELSGEGSKHEWGNFQGEGLGVLGYGVVVLFNQGSILFC